MDSLEIVQQLRTPLLLLKEGRLDDALAHWSRIRDLAPAHPAVHDVGSVLFEAADRPAELAECLRHVVSAFPERLEMWRLLAFTERRLERTEPAIRTLREGLTHHPEAKGLWAPLGVLLVETSRAEEGQQALQKAIELDPSDPFPMGHLASLHETLHRHDDAKAVALQALEIDPGNPVAEIVLARVDLRQGRALDARRRLTALLQRDELPARQRASAGLQLARILDGVGDASAWDAAVSGHVAKRTLPEMAQQDRQWVQRTAAEAVASWPPARPDDDPVPPCEEPPIFLVGFPRSGTTLLESVLASAAELGATDEADLLGTIKRRLAAHLGIATPPSATLLDRMSASDVVAVRETYLDLGRAHFGARWIDKLPMNVLQIPWIRRLFPTAPIVVALRDPRDCLVSGFFQDLTINRAMVHFSDPVDLATAYVHTMTPWQTWRSDPAIDGIEVHYERLVEDFDTTAKEMLARIGLPYSDAVRRFHERSTQRQIRTPSYHAVSQPIYRRAVGRWRRYHHRIPAQALDHLEPVATAFGYASALSAV
ncbi:MAG: sulfotransferase [Myxococcales bacterium]|nr:sulfotransferase [Myxococcales bacterium]